MSLALLTAGGALMLAAGWSGLALWGRWDLRLPSVALLVLLPLAGDLWLGPQEKHAFGLVAAAPLPGLVASIVRRRGEALVSSQAFARHPLIPFAALYLAAATYGLVWGLARGNEPLVALGQTLSAVLFGCGFFLAGPVVNRRGDARLWGSMALGVAVLSVPGLIPVARWLAGMQEAHLVRFIDRGAFYAPVCALIALFALGPIHRWIRLSVATLFALVALLTFTRSYWLGLAAGLLFLAAVALVRARHASASRLRFSLPGLGFGVGLAGSLGLLAWLSGLHESVLERILSSHAGSHDLSIDVRGLELSAAIAALRSVPLLGLGSGGTFLSVYQPSSSQIFYGPTNFLHNAYLYLPMKFGVLGFAALFSLAGGVIAALVLALRRARRGELLSPGFTSVLVLIVVASITAPNLVDPSYAVFIGLVAYLAAEPLPAPADTHLPAEAAVAEGDRRPAENAPPVAAVRQDASPRAEAAPSAASGAAAPAPSGLIAAATGTLFLATLAWRLLRLLGLVHRPERRSPRPSSRG